MNADEQRLQLARIVLEEKLELWDVWLRYFALAGRASEEEFALYAVGETQLPPLQRDLIAMALRELVSEHRERTGRSDTGSRPRRLSDHGE